MHKYSVHHAVRAGKNAYSRRIIFQIYEKEIPLNQSDGGSEKFWQVQNIIKIVDSFYFGMDSEICEQDSRVFREKGITLESKNLIHRQLEIYD